MGREWNISNPSQPNPVYDHLMGRPVDCECRNSQVKRSSSNINHLDNDKSCEYLFCCYWPLPSAFRSIHSNFCLFGSLVVFLSFSSRFPLYSTLHLACTYCFHTHPLGISSREGGDQVRIRFYSLDCCCKEANCFAVCKLSFCSCRQRNTFYTTSQVLCASLIY